MKLVCVLCGRDKFTQKSAHQCKGGYRKKNIVWAIFHENAFWRFKKKSINPQNK